MLVLITYDVSIDDSGARRLRRVAKVCTNYGQRVQNSVFECVVNQAQLTVIKHELSTIIDERLDSVRFYTLGDNYNRRVEQIGKNRSYDPNSELVI